jgi:hypothetical protein
MRKITDFLIPIFTYTNKKKFWTLFSEFFSFLAQQTHFRAGRHENKEMHLFYFGLRILLPTQIQLLLVRHKSKNPINLINPKKSTSPTAQGPCNGNLHQDKMSEKGSMSAMDTES